MFETITKHVRENSVVRFLLSHLIILLAALLICAVGFRSAFVIVRNDVLDAHPELRDELEKLAGTISDQDMAEMNHAVETDGQEPREVAEDFLRDRDLI